MRSVAVTMICFIHGPFNRIIVGFAIYEVRLLLFPRMRVWVHVDFKGTCHVGTRASNLYVFA